MTKLEEITERNGATMTQHQLIERLATAASRADEKQLSDNYWKYIKKARQFFAMYEALALEERLQLCERQLSELIMPGSST
jgi:sulfur relay (sulfurtransferase) DsrC/TusE family protein